ncbi:MAG: energy transducer TonB [Candidatus Acidiferrales bacterium]
MKYLAAMPAAIFFCIVLGFLAIHTPQIPTNAEPAQKAPSKAESSALCEKAKTLPDAGKAGYTHPQCVFCPNPRYTDEAFRDKTQGTVVLSMAIDTDGRAYCVEPVKRLGHGLDEASVKEVADEWRFKPALGPDGKPAAVRERAEIEFHLHPSR